MIFSLMEGLINIGLIEGLHRRPMWTAYHDVTMHDVKSKHKSKRRSKQEGAIISSETTRISSIETHSAQTYNAEDRKNQPNERDSVCVDSYLFDGARQSSKSR